MMNCNPETVSTDYDTSSRLYFEPITVEDVLNVIDVVSGMRGSVLRGGGSLMCSGMGRAARGSWGSPEAQCALLDLLIPTCRRSPRV